MLKKPSLDELGAVKAAVKKAGDSMHLVDLGPYHGSSKRLFEDEHGPDYYKKPHVEIIADGRVVIGVLLHGVLPEPHFVPRPADITTDQLATELLRIQREVTKGTALKALRLIEEEDADVPTPEFNAPAKYKKRLLRTIASRDDSPGKAKWRATLGEEWNKVFPEGVDAIPKNDRGVICFPGMGKEADLWKNRGFENEDLIFIERDQQTATFLEQKYPGAFVINEDFLRAFHTMDYYLKKSPHSPNKVSVISIDPYNSLSIQALHAVESLLGHTNIFADKSFVGVNFAMGRRLGLKQIMRLCERTGITVSECEGEDKMHEWNGKVVSSLIPRICAGKFHDAFQSELLCSGDYEGDRGTRMYFAMHQVNRRKDGKK